MSDRTSLTAHIELLRPTTDADLTRIKESEYLEYADEIDRGVAGQGHLLPEELHVQVYEISCGDAEYVAKELEEMFSGHFAGIEVWEDPKYEYLGTLWRLRAGEGSWFSAECDAQGNIVLQESIIRDLCGSKGPNTLPELRCALLAALGDKERLLDES